MRPIAAKIFREDLFKPSSTQHLLNCLVIFLAICAILYYGQEILIPIVIALLLSFLLAPCVRALQKVWLPKSVSIIIVVLIAFGIFVGITTIVATALTNLATELPRYESNLRQKARSLKLFTSGGTSVEKAANVLQDLRTELEKSDKSGTPEIISAKPIPVELRQNSYGPLDPIISVVSILIHPLTQLGIVILMVILFLFNKEDLRTRLIRLTGTGDLNRTTEAIDEAGKRLGKLFKTQISLNAATGALVGTVLAIIGVPGAILWGILTFVLRFVPYIGALMAGILPVIIAAAIGEGWTLAILTAVILMTIELAIGQFIEPLIFGKMTGLSPVAVVASAAFWTALWGPIGLIIATPMTIGLLVVGRNIESMDFLEVLLGNESALTPDHALYQRLLASDPIEAAELADSYVKDKRLDLFITDVAVPSLLLADNDQLRGVLPLERQTSVVHSFSEMLDDLISSPDRDPQQSASIVLISPPGVINFAATLAFSAVLKIKSVPHLMLGQDAIAPGKFPQIDTTNTEWVCLCYLNSPSEAKHNYVLRRLSGHFSSSKVIGVTWLKSDTGMELQTTESFLSLVAPNSLRPDDQTGLLPITSASV